MPHPDQPALREQLVGDDAHALRRDDPAPEQVTHVRAARVDASLLAVERECVEPSTLRDPERLVEPAPELVGLLLEPVGEIRVAPRLAGDLRQPTLGVVHVALDLDRRDRRLGHRAVVEALGVPRVLPRLVREPALRAAVVLHEPVPVEIPMAVDPLERP